MDAVVSTHDLGDLVAAAIARKLDLRGPDPEAVFRCLHKYYGRLLEPNAVGSVPLPLAGQEHCHHYPAFVKPPWLKLGLLGFKVENNRELAAALGVARREYPRWSRQYYPLFEQAIDISRYPLATADIMLVEDFVEGPQVTVEGWVQDQQISLWGITDTNTYPGTRVIDGFSSPSRLPPDMQNAIGDYSRAVIERHGLDDTFFNLELWVTEDGFRLTEVNSRAAVCFAGIYRPALAASIFAAVADVACGLAPRRRPQPTGLVAGQFNLVSLGPGRAGDLVDYEASAAVAGLKLFRPRGAFVAPTSEFGVVLGQFEVAGSSYDEIHAEAETVRRRVLVAESGSDDHRAVRPLGSQPVVGVG